MSASDSLFKNQSDTEAKRLADQVAEMRSLDPAGRAAAIPTSNDAAAALAGTRTVSDDEFKSAKSQRETLMSDPEWAKKLLAGDPTAKGEMLRLNSYISTRLPSF